jgi:hypothetical protein
VRAKFCAHVAYFESPEGTICLSYSRAECLQMRAAIA